MSALIEAQFEFCQNIAQLIVKIASEGFICTFGDAYRSEEKLPCPQCGEPITYQWMLYNAGRSKVVSGGNHSKRLAIDFNLFKELDNDLVRVSDKTELQDVFDYWELLNPLNRAGGNFKSIYDPGHFEMNI